MCLNCTLHNAQSLCWMNAGQTQVEPWLGLNYRLCYDLDHISLLFGGSVHFTFPLACPVIADLPVSQLSPDSHVWIAKGCGRWLRRKQPCFSSPSIALETLILLVSISGHSLGKDQEHLPKWVRLNGSVLAFFISFIHIYYRHAPSRKTKMTVTNLSNTCAF